MERTFLDLLPRDEMMVKILLEELSCVVSQAVRRSSAKAARLVRLQYDAPFFISKPWRVKAPPKSWQTTQKQTKRTKMSEKNAFMLRRDQTKI